MKADPYTSEFEDFFYSVIDLNFTFKFPIFYHNVSLVTVTY